MDKGWAEWIAWQLEKAGQRTLIQAWDFKSGGVFPGDMRRALQQSARVIAVLSPAYMESGFCQTHFKMSGAGGQRSSDLDGTPRSCETRRCYDREGSSRCGLADVVNQYL